MDASRCRRSAEVPIKTSTPSRASTAVAAKRTAGHPWLRKSRFWWPWSHHIRSNFLARTMTTSTCIWWWNMWKEVTCRKCSSSEMESSPKMRLGISSASVLRVLATCMLITWSTEILSWKTCSVTKITIIASSSSTLALQGRKGTRIRRSMTVVAPWSILPLKCFSTNPSIRNVTCGVLVLSPTSCSTVEYVRFRG